MNNLVIILPTYVVRAIRDENQETGRAREGIAQFSRKSIKIKTERIKTKNFRLQAQILVFPNTRLLWINSYLPNGPRTIAFNDNELLEVLQEVEMILDSSDFDDCIWQGDMNWDMSRQSGFSKTMKQFMERLGLISVWEHYPIDYTHIHTDLSSTSSLDHFIVNERLLPLVLDAGPMHLGDNLSRHSPILLKLDLGSIPARKLTKSVNLRKPAWYKADQECRDQYTNCLYEKLSSLQLPESLLCSDPHCQNDTHSLERDNLVIDMMSQVIESSHQYIPTSSGKSSRKHSDSPIDKSIPGWKDIVKPYNRMRLNFGMEFGKVQTDLTRGC